MKYFTTQTSKRFCTAMCYLITDLVIQRTHKFKSKLLRTDVRWGVDSFHIERGQGVLNVLWLSPGGLSKCANLVNLRLPALRLPAPLHKCSRLRGAVNFWWPLKTLNGLSEAQLGDSFKNQRWIVKSDKPGLTDYFWKAWSIKTTISWKINFRIF